MSRSRTSLKQARVDIAARLRCRRAEIEQAAFVRVSALSGSTGGEEPQYKDGLRAAVSAAVDYGLIAIELGEERSPPVPAVLHSQARLAARNNVSLDTVLRRYFAGYTLLGDFLIQEAEESGVQGAALQSLMRAPATLFERLAATITEEYNRELEARSGSAEERTAARIRSLLAGERLDTTEFGYEFDAWHVGALGAGTGVAESIRELATTLDRRCLIVRGGEQTVWAWLGGRRRFDPEELDLLASSTWPPRVSLAIGEPGNGLYGWRQTHQQARAALLVALRSPSVLVRYAEVALLASMLQDPLLATSLRDLYLSPLADERDGGKVLRQTLRAYFLADRNASSAAAALGVSRRTVTNRLRAIEARLDRQLNSAGAEIEAALRFYDLEGASTRLDPVSIGETDPAAES